MIANSITFACFGSTKQPSWLLCATETCSCSWICYDTICVSTIYVLTVACRSPVEGDTCKEISVFVFRSQFVGLKTTGDPGSKTLCFNNLDYGQCRKF